MHQPLLISLLGLAFSFSADDVGCRPFAARQPQPDEIKVSSAPMVLDKPGGNYVLVKSVEAQASCFAIVAEDVTLDLNGHTVKYGTGRKDVQKTVVTYNSRQGGNVGHSAIACPSRPDTTEDWPGHFRWNAAVKGIVVKNGKIVQGGGAGLTYSPAVDLGGTVGAEISDLTIEVSAPDSEAIITGVEAKLHHCTFVHNGTHVTNRHAQLAVIVSGEGTEVSNCKVEGGPQAGIKAMKGSIIRENLIRHRATVTNGYGVQGYGQANVQVYRNTIMPYNGRGIHLSEKSENWQVHHNYVEVRETANREYKELQTHGIKLEGTRNSKVYNNVVLAVSTAGGQPTPLNLSVEADSANQVYGNVFVALTVNKEPAYAAYLIGSDGQGTQISDNVFYTNGVGVHVPWDGARNHVFHRCQFRKIDPADAVTAVSFANAQPSSVAFVDCEFRDGLDPTKCSYPFADWSKDATCWVLDSFLIEASDGDKALAGAAVSIAEHKGDEVMSGATDGNGRFLVNMPERAMIYSPPDAGKLVPAEPCSVKLTGGVSRSFGLIPAAPMEAIVDIRGSGPIILTPSEARPGVVGEAYRLTLAATGEDRTEWSISDGELPAGLRLAEDIIEGTLTEAGRFELTLKAKQAGQEVSKRTRIEVAPAPAKPFWRERVEQARRK